MLAWDGIGMERVVFVGGMEKDQNLLLKGIKNQLKILREESIIDIQYWGAMATGSKPRPNFCG